jgi:hypothetical protein
MSSVNVAVRVRPYNAREISMGNLQLIIKMNGPLVEIRDPETDKVKKFTFDFSYQSHTGFNNADHAGAYMHPDPGSDYADQDLVFKHLGVGVLNNAFAGFHVCLFAYG